MLSDDWNPAPHSAILCGMDQFDSISYEQACSVIQRHADREVSFLTSPFPGMSIEIVGQLFVQSADPFAFAVVADERLSLSAMPFPDCIFQIPKSSSGAVEAVLCAMPGDEPGTEVMMWMVRFA